VSGEILVKVMLGSLSGAAMGGLYFGSLWAVVRRVPDASRPARLVAGSYLARLAALGLGFWAVLRLGGASALLAALVGLLVARRIIVGRIAHSIDQPPPTGSNEGAAPWS
jgi:F1F0 ATPase subunit 2